MIQTERNFTAECDTCGKSYQDEFICFGNKDELTALMLDDDWKVIEDHCKCPDCK